MANLPIPLVIAWHTELIRNDLDLMTRQILGTQCLIWGGCNLLTFDFEMAPIDHEPNLHI